MKECRNTNLILSQTIKILVFIDFLDILKDIYENNYMKTLKNSQTITSQKSIFTNHLNDHITKKEQKIKDTQNTFLQMLTTQLKYQDPNNPVDTFGIMNHMTNMNQLMTLLQIESDVEKIANINDSQTSHLLDLVGKNVLLKDSSFIVDNNVNSVKLGFKPKQMADKINIKVFDEGNNKVFETTIDKDFNNDMINNVNLSSLSPGFYKIKCEGLHNNNPIPVDTYTQHKITQLNQNGWLMTQSDQLLSLEDIIAVTA